MGFEIVMKHTPKHTCDTGEMLNSGQVAEGDIVKCTECNKLWECYLIPAGGMQWDPWPARLSMRPLAKDA